MPQCTKCQKKQPKLNRGDLCKDCFEKEQPEEEHNGGVQQPIDESELSKSVNDMTLGDIVNVIERIVVPITSKLDKLEALITSAPTKHQAEMELLKAEVNEKEQTIETLTQIVVNMQASLNRIDSDKRITNIMVAGLSENPIDDGGNVLNSDNQKVKKLLDVMAIDESVPRENLQLSRIGQPNNSATRLLKVNVQSKESRDVILEKAKHLKDEREPWCKVYVKKDVHIVYAKENQRLNNRKKELKERNPESNIRIVDGKLLIDQRVVDRNTFFR